MDPFWAGLAALVLVGPVPKLALGPALGLVLGLVLELARGLVLGALMGLSMGLEGFPLPFAQAPGALRQAVQLVLTTPFFSKHMF